MIPVTILIGLLLALAAVMGALSVIPLMAQNSTTPETDFFSKIEGLFLAASSLITIIASMVVYFVNKKQAAQKGEVTAQQKQLRDVAKYVIVGLQKGAEIIGENRDIAKMVYESNVSPEERKRIELAAEPFIEQSTMRLNTANNQAQTIKGALIQAFGPEVDPDKDDMIPHEPLKVSADLRDPSKFAIDTT